EGDIATIRVAAIAALAAGDLQRAAAGFERILQQRHDDADAHHSLGLIHLARDEMDAAADAFLMATHFRPGDAVAWYHLALVARRRGDRPEAVRCLEQAVAVRPDYADAHNALGADRLALGEIDAAVAAFEQAVSLSPRHAQMLSNLGYVLMRDRADYARGAGLIRQALELAPEDAGVWCNFGLVLNHEGRLEEAIAACDRVLAREPGLDEARLNRALAKLKRAQYAEAWPDYEARKRVRSNYLPRPYAFPEWRGEALAGRTLLVYGEQGIGDEIMFASCLADLQQTGARVILDCAPRLATLLQRSFPAVQVQGVAQNDPQPAWLATAGTIDYQIASGSLPAHFRQTPAAFPHDVSYLVPDPARVARWRARLAADGRRAVGIAWRGGLASTRSSLRSTALLDWAPLLGAADCVFVSLQHGDCAQEVAALRAQGVAIEHWPEAIADLDELAALIGALDLVISVQTAAVHFAGALGRPVWVLVPAVAEWRYGEHGATMPWYPSAELFRQGRDGDWTPVFASVTGRLARFAGTGDLTRPAAEADAAAEPVAPAAEAIEALLALAQAGRVVEAEFRAGLYCARRPADAALANAHGNLLRLREQPAAAEDAYRRALALDPLHLAAAANLGLCLFERNDIVQAETVLQALLERAPGHTEALFNLARVRIERGDDDGALALLERCLAQDPEYAAAHAQRGGLLLKQGRWAEGWDEYEWRDRAQEWLAPTIPPVRRWRGDPQPDACLFVRAEQGIGDQLMFAACVPDAQARVAQVVLECDPRLATLLERSFPGVRTLPWTRVDAPAAPDTTAEIHLGSLPGLFRRRTEDFPARAGYLVADPARLAHWRAQWAGRPGPVIGIAWRAGTATTRGSARSLAASDLLAALRGLGATAVSLQRDATAAELQAASRASGVELLAWPGIGDDFENTAALVQSLSAVVSVCGTPVHLAGALGVRTCVLVPQVAEWRYGGGGARMPWYPTVQLLRQTQAEDWRPPLAALRAILSAPR
ncbi:MAG: tetratricopeptide repeat protein, partial [Burkholderiales bacterium]